MADDEIDCDALIAPLAEPARLRRLKAIYVRRFDNLPPEVVADGIQDAIANLLKFCHRKASAIRDPGAAETMLHTTIRRTLISAVRHSEVLDFVAYDDDYVALGALHRAEEGEVDTAPEKAASESERDEPKRASRDRKLPPSKSEDEGLENVLVEQLDVDQLMAQVMSELDDRYRRIVLQLLEEWMPDEIAEAFGKSKGYRLRDWARIKLCRIFGRLADLGNDMAERLFSGGKCPTLLTTVSKPM